MEQQLTGGGVPYLFTLYGDPGRAIRDGKAKYLLSDMPTTERNIWALGLYSHDLSRLVFKGLKIIQSGLTAKGRNITDNLSPEGKIVVELCLQNSTLCDQMTYDRMHCNGHIWSEDVVYQLDGWAERGECRYNRTHLRLLKLKYKLFEAISDRL